MAQGMILVFMYQALGSIPSTEREKEENKQTKKLGSYPVSYSAYHAVLGGEADVSNITEAGK